MPKCPDCGKELVKVDSNTWKCKSCKDYFADVYFSE